MQNVTILSDAKLKYQTNRPVTNNASNASNEKAYKICRVKVLLVISQNHIIENFNLIAYSFSNLNFKERKFL